jgi:hypothetical protein
MVVQADVNSLNLFGGQTQLKNLIHIMDLPLAVRSLRGKSRISRVGEHVYRRWKTSGVMVVIVIVKVKKCVETRFWVVCEDVLGSKLD